MNKLKAVFFDLDGTLRDSRPAIWPAVHQLFDELHLPQPESAVLAKYIHHLEAVREVFAPGHPTKEFHEHYDALMKPLLSSIVLYGQTLEVLKQLREEEYYLGVVSSSRQAKGWANNYLPDQLDIVVGPEDTPQVRKPHPAPILFALGELGLGADEAVIVGDLAADMEAGQRAQLRATIGVTHGFGSREMLEQARADYIIDSLAELPGVIRFIEQNSLAQAS
jgi:HAD superfamily hydrolase (TIGR01509 family)